MISFGRKHYKYDMQYILSCILSRHWNLSISLMAKTTAQSVCKNKWLFVCLYKSLPSTCFALFYNFPFMCNAFVFCLKKQDILFEKAVLILILYHLFILMFIFIERFVIKNYVYKTPVIIWSCHILFSENYHQLFKHWLLKLSKISWLHVFKRLIFPSKILKDILKYILHYLSVTLSYSVWHNYWLLMSYVLKWLLKQQLTCVHWIWSYHMRSLSTTITDFTHFQGNVSSI